MGVLGVYYLLENIIHYYYCQSEGGKDSNQRGEDIHVHCTCTMYVTVLVHACMHVFIPICE